MIDPDRVSPFPHQASLSIVTPYRPDRSRVATALRSDRITTNMLCHRVRAEDSWEGGLILAHDCPHGVECLMEVHETLEPHDSQTLINLGARWKFATSS
jgi:hypothetical protein